MLKQIAAHRDISYWVLGLSLSGLSVGCSHIPMPEAPPELSGNQPPIANAGDDVTTSSTSPFWLDGRNSSDPDGDTLTYKWEQISGNRIDLGQPNGAMASYWPSHGTRQFRLTVTDVEGNVSAPDEVTITHEPGPAAAECDIWGRDDLVE